MSPALLEPPTTEEQLRERAEELARDVAEQLEAAEPAATTATAPPTDDELRDERLARRQAFFGELRATSMNL
ncbi:MAG: hypothetical protein M3417_10255, partial [Actinomycetota bacterium]|nr:hypothetical protein [Actinomycetota bacterium]